MNFLKPKEKNEVKPTADEQQPPKSAVESLVHFSIDLAPGEELEITLNSKSIGEQRASEKHRVSPQQAGSTFRAWLSGIIWGENNAWLQPATLVVYLLVMLAGLQSIPPFFTSQEAVHLVQAAEFLKNGLHVRGELLPAFFEFQGHASLGSSVYLMVLPFLTLGASAWVVRGMAVLCSLAAVIWGSGLLKKYLGLKHAWSFALLLAVSPGWVFLARSGLDAVLLAACLTGFLYYFQAARQGSLGWLYLAAALAGFGFYASWAGRVLVPVVLLVVVGFNFSWLRRHAKTAWVALGGLAVSALPLVRQLITHPAFLENDLSSYGDVWNSNQSFFDHLLDVFLRYLAGLDPRFWVLPHQLAEGDPYVAWVGRLSLLSLALALIGMIFTLRHWKSQSRYRFVWLAFGLAPLGGALTGVTTGLNVGVIWVVTVFAVIGLNGLLDWLQNRFSAQVSWLLAAAWLLLVVGCLTTWLNLNTRSAWQDGQKDPVPYRTAAVYQAMDDFHYQQPALKLLISPALTGEENMVQRLYNLDQGYSAPFSIEEAIQKIMPDIHSKAFVLDDASYQQVLDSQLFQPPEVLKVLPGINLSTDVRIVKLEYLADVEAIVAAIEAERVQLVEDSLLLNGQPVPVRHSQLEMGPLANLFDHQPDSLIKTKGVNPLVLEMDFPDPVMFQGANLQVGNESLTATFTLTLDSGEERQYALSAAASEGNKEVQVDFEGQKIVKKLRLELLDTAAEKVSPVHLWEIRFY